ncbi:DUF58 domain-containing protein [Actinomycetospora callitridis]|uniref:DUF58 domain-containing protein n=1 Tax=Actinomycetospora callitridis TaxID=913944 RepID=UPI00236626D2|nr:DUF58 domain-containing protein [Actinomycetospora callitridis]MDD7918424.1 DUF58 domain-containing protein [Actinomycetospora callitridis]
MAVTGRLALLVALGALVVGLLVPSLLGVLVVSGALALLAVVDALAAVPVGSLHLDREQDPARATTLRLGTSLEVALRVANPGRRRANLVLRDAWEPSAGALPARHRLVVPAGERRRVVTTLTPTRRGDRDAVRVTVRSLGPLGLAARQGGRAVPARVRVLPPFGSRRHLPSRLARMRELDGRRAIQVRGQGTEFDSLREYVAGDDVRSLDWRASARSTELVVRTWRPERDRHVLVVLDTGRSSAGRVGDAPRLDAALDTALLLAALASRGGDRVDLLALDREVRASVLGATAGDLLPALVTAMAPLEPRLVETDMRLLAASVLARAGQRSLVVLVTGLDEAAVAEGLDPVLGSLLRRHTVLLAAVDDPELATMAAGRGDAEAVYTAAAAETARAARRRTAERLGRRGVEVVDAGPEELPPAVADRYLALKAAGRL